MSVKRQVSRKRVRKATKYEKRHARAHRGKHVGGPGKPDYYRGKVQGEVKCWKRPMAKGDVQREVAKGRREIVSKSGFTPDAKRYVRRYRRDVRLIHPRSEAQKRRSRKRGWF